jgi:hypothetical protein
MPAEYSIGIDLGTTNCVLAYAPLADEQSRVQVLLIPQLVAPSTIESREMLPSFLYLHPSGEQASGAFDLPWEKSSQNVVGILAQRQSAEVPTRTVVAAKSWLAYSKVDRHQPILPWNAPADVAKVSPVEASRAIFGASGRGLDAAFPDAPIAEQQVVLTVPASFDASARELTREAAFLAGLPHEHGFAGRATGGAVRLAGRHGRRVAAKAERRRHAPRLRRRRRHHRFHPHRRHRRRTASFPSGASPSEITHSSAATTWISPWHIRQPRRFRRKGRRARSHGSRFPSGTPAETPRKTLLARKARRSIPVAVLGRGSKLVGGRFGRSRARGRSELLVDGFFPVCDTYAGQAGPPPGVGVPRDRPAV